jgi:hypothetical protein
MLILVEHCSANIGVNGTATLGNNATISDPLARFPLIVVKNVGGKKTPVFA